MKPQRAQRQHRTTTHAICGHPGEVVQRVQVRENLPVHLAGPEEDMENGDGSLFAAGAKKEAVVADSPAEHAPPLLALEWSVTICVMTRAMRS
jgi:hypothetical protein